MAELKDRRQRAIADLIRADAVSSQEELGERLADLGYTVTQATISRDLEQIGAMKVRREGRYVQPEGIAGEVGHRPIPATRRSSGASCAGSSSSAHGTEWS